MKNYLIALKVSKSSAGFTLTELLIGAALTGVVISAAGFGLVTIMNANERAEDQNQRRMELNRALDFIADEVKMAQGVLPENAVDRMAIAVNTDINVHTALAPNFPSDCDNPTDDVHCALIVRLPGVGQRVIYYVAPPPNNSPWLGPRVIYRWGPNFNANGTYSNSDNPANWTVEPLVDQIVGNREKHSDCLSGWSPNLSPEDRDSFYACVNSVGRVAEVFLVGHLPQEDPPILPVSTRVFARSTAPAP